MTMRLVGRSMRSQVVSTGAMRSLFDIGHCPELGNSICNNTVQRPSQTQ